MNGKKEFHQTKRSSLALWLFCSLSQLNSSAKTVTSKLRKLPLSKILSNLEYVEKVERKIHRGIEPVLLCPRRKTHI